jgi:hypothetical protein
VTGHHDSDRTVMDYLLGRLEADAQADLDERSFVDDAWEETRAAAADDLIEAYLTGALDPGDRQAFEVHFLASAPHRERFELLADLRTVLAGGAARDAAAPPPRPISSAAWVAAAAVVLASLVVLFFYAREAPDAKVASVTPPPNTVATAMPPPRATAEARRTRTATVTVPEGPRALAVALDLDVRTVRFAIPVPESAAPSYSVALLRGGEPVWQRDDLVPSAAGAPIEVGVPAEVLAAGDAVLSIEPEATRASSAPPVARAWPLRITRR